MAASPFQLGSPAQLVEQHKSGDDVYHFVGVPGAVDDSGQALGVASAGCIPFIETDDPNRVNVLLPVADMEVGSLWEPSLAMFGGKVAQHDTHWTHTCQRAMAEGLGEVARHVQPLLSRIAAMCSAQPPGVSTVYVPSAEHQALFLPVHNWLEAGTLLKLPGMYYQAIQGQPSQDLGGDTTRSAQLLVWMQLQRTGENEGWQVASTDLSHLAKGAVAFASSSQHAAKFAQPWELPVKPELAGALRRWLGPGL